jgi:hypothetical protein
MTPALFVPPVYFHRPSLICSTYDLYERSMLRAARFDGSKRRKVRFIDR